MIKVIRGMIYTLLFGFLIFLDRITKHLVLTQSLPKLTIPYVSYNVTMNRGISWGLLHTHDNQKFIFISLVIAFTIIMLMIHTYHRWKKNEMIWPYMVVLAGATSNMIDRICLGGVVDFIEIICFSLTWPVFNIADICIVAGISCIMIQELYQDDDR